MWWIQLITTAELFASLPNLWFGDIDSWDPPHWEYLHHGNWQILQNRTLRGGWGGGVGGGLVYQHTTAIGFPLECFPVRSVARRQADAQLLAWFPASRRFSCSKTLLAWDICYLLLPQCLYQPLTTGLHETSPLPDPSISQLFPDVSTVFT